MRSALSGRGGQPPLLSSSRTASNVYLMGKAKQKRSKFSPIEDYRHGTIMQCLSVVHAPLESVALCDL